MLFAVRGRFDGWFKTASMSVYLQLNCPFCGGDLTRTASDPSETPPEYGVLVCSCGRYPIVAGIPIIRKGIVGNTGQSAHEVITLIEAGHHREALLAMVLPPPPMSAMKAPVSVRALRGWQERAEALFSQPHDQLSVCELVDFFYGNVALSDARQRQLEQPDIRQYFLYRFSQPRYAIAVSLCSVISEPARPILDLACGIGHITRQLIGRSQGQPVVGLDRDFFCLYIAKHWLAADATYVCGEADTPLPFRDGAFSAVFCSDAFQLFENKVHCARELKRLTRPDGVMVLSALPTVLETHRTSLPLQGYETLVADMPHRFVTSYDILSRYLQKQGPPLARQVAMERVGDDPWVSVVASHQQAVFKDYGPFDDWPHARGSLRVDPLYKVERRDEMGNVHLQRIFPSRWFEHENTERRLKDYLPETVCVTETTLGDLSKGHRTQDIESLLRQCVVVGFPDRYLPATYQVNEEVNERLEAAIGGDFYIEKARVSDLIGALVPSGNTYIMVDEREWDVGEVDGSRHRIDFFERGGKYWGPPADDETAIRELERLRDLGATFIVFGWPAIWWLEHYVELGHYLYSRFRCVLQHDRLVIFDLRSRLVL
jgi:SAM-dependent methyltransferase